MSHDAHAMRLLDPHSALTTSNSPVSMLRQPSYKRHRTQAQTSALASAESEARHLGPINDLHQGPKWVASLRTAPEPSQGAGTAEGWVGSGYPSGSRLPSTVLHTAVQQLPGKLAGGTGLEEGYAHRAWETRQWAIDSQALWGSAQARHLDSVVL